MGLTIYDSLKPKSQMKLTENLRIMDEISIMYDNQTTREYNIVRARCKKFHLGILKLFSWAFFKCLLWIPIN